MDERLLNRVREALVNVSPIVEKRMFGGVCFMVDDKLCICVNSHEMLCRINPDEFEAALEMDGVRPMEQRTRTAKGYVFVHEDVLGNKRDFDAWVNKALEYNKIAKASKKTK
ncbi:TfoX/Sxy family protein [Mucilaginibacter gilvus]|uniref:TfoX family protein n=1 Tax=Mucilaginibacter gilvus TaxID=2305909 RepID=A0A3S3WZJ7_9SPHI|nr:TfoX/Sxy family protein [Mucilaginibacter gilvus]RWY47234.1 TfoX family protein [Mucilaginibacter gilvus]